MTSWTPKLTNVAGRNGTAGKGEYVDANGVVTFTAQIVAKTKTYAATDAGFGLTLPVPARSGTRIIFPLSLDGRDADRGVWTGEAQVYAGSDGTEIDRLRVTGMGNGAALQNIAQLYGTLEEAAEAEIITVTGSYIRA